MGKDPTHLPVSSAPGRDQDDRALLDLHRATTVEALWRALSTFLTRALPLHSCSLFLNYFDLGHGFRGLHHQTLPGAVLPWDLRRRVSPAPEFLARNVGVKMYRLHELVPAGQRLSHTDYFRQVMCVEGWHSLVGLPYWREGQLRAVLVVRRSAEQGDFSGEDMALLEQLYPHVDIALDRVRDAHELQLHRACLQACFGWMPDGNLVLDWSGRVVLRNRQAAEICLRWNYGAEEARRLHPEKNFAVPIEIVEACAVMGKEWSPRPARPGSGLARGGSARWVRKNNDEATVRLVETPDLTLTKPVFLVQFMPVATARVPLRPAARSHLIRAGLTVTEMSVAEFAAQGFGNDEIASHFGKSAKTVAAQLTSIFRKLNVDSRAKLVALLQQAESIPVYPFGPGAALSRSLRE